MQSHDDLLKKSNIFQVVFFFLVSLLLIPLPANAALTTTATVTVKNPAGFILVNNMPMTCSASCPADCFYGFNTCAANGNYTAIVTYTHSGTNCDDSFLEPPYTEITPETVLYYCDVTPPTITDDCPVGWVNSDFTVTLTPLDDASGIREVRYCEGALCNPSIILASPYQLTYTTDQNTIVRYRAWDDATPPGTPNPSLIGEYNVKLDKSAPTTTCTNCALENPTVAGDDTTFSPGCTDTYSGCKNTTICADASCTTEYCDFNFGSDCSIMTIPCTFELDKPFWYYSCDNAHNCETVKGPSIYDIKKANGCACTSSQECIAECIGGQCWVMNPSYVDFDINDTTISFGKTARILVKITNKNPISINVPLHIGSSDELKNWMWFTGHRTDEHRRDLNVTVGPFETKIVSIDILGAKTGKYTMYIGPDADYANKYTELEIKIIYKSKGVFSTTPGLSWTGFMALLTAALAIMAHRTKRFKH